MRKWLILLLLLLIPKIVSSAVIDVGLELGNQTGVNGYIMVTKDNPANDTGTIDYVNIYIDTGLGNELSAFGSFTDEGSNALSTNGYAGDKWTCSKGAYNSFDAPSDFTAFDIDSGDYIGLEVIGSRANLSYAASGYDGLWYFALPTSSQMPVSSKTFSWFAGGGVSVYATGETGGEPPPTAPEPVTILQGTNIIQGNNKFFL